jgi:hypothetical protein
MVNKKESPRYSIVTATKLSGNSMLAHEHDSEGDMWPYLWQITYGRNYR